MPSQITSDPVRLKQILINLCSNAVKFTEHGRVGVYVRCDRANERLEFDVIDTGVGLTAEQASRLFRPFTQADSSITRKYGGTGLGLSLSKRLASLLGGDLELLRSMPGEGSRFRLTVAAGGLADVEWIADPARRMKELSQGDSLGAGRTVPRVAGRILVAEDTEELQQLVRHYLARMGADVEIVGNGSEAMERALREPVDLILMDMQMPIMGGLEATAKLRAAGYQAPIVALTANAMQEDAQRAIEAGCNAVITKPIDRQQLYRLVATHLMPAAANITSAAALVSELLETEPELRDLVVKFVAELPHKVDALAQLLNDDSWPELKAELHKLKGLGGNFGYPAITRLAATMESDLREGDLERVRRTFDELRAISNRVVAGMPAEDRDSPRSVTHA